LYTDHKPLIDLFNNKEPNNMRHIRWCIKISMLRIKFVYEPGKRNCLADALSRIRNRDRELNLNEIKANKETKFITETRIEKQSKI